MKPIFIILLSFSLASCGKKNKEDDNDTGNKNDELQLTKEESQAAGQLYGYRDTNRMLSERLFTSEDHLMLSYYLEPTGFPNQAIVEIVSRDVIVLLGAQQANGQKSEAVNVTPNPMNSLLWFVVLEQFSKDLAEVCGDKVIEHRGFTAGKMRPEVSKKLKDSCSLTSNDPEFDGKIKSLMRSLLLFDGTELDEKLVTEYARNEIFKEKTGKDALRDLLITTLYNPNLLIRK